jgi:hypothetical protein
MAEAAGCWGRPMYPHWTDAADRALIKGFHEGLLFKGLCRVVGRTSGKEEEFLMRLPEEARAVIEENDMAQIHLRLKHHGLIGNGPKSALVREIEACSAATAASA